MAPSHETHRIAVVDTAWNKFNLSCSVGRRAFGCGLNVFALVLWVLLAASGAQGQTVTTTVPGNTTSAIAVAVDLVRNNIYVANAAGSNAGSVTVIDGATSTATATITDPNATNPQDVAVNPVTNTIYVANYGSNNVTVIDGATGTVTADVSTGANPRALAVNPATNKIYVADYGGGVTVIDGASNTATTVTDSNAIEPYAVAVNPVTNTIYVANYGSTNVTVINGTSNAVTTTVSAGTNPDAVAVNPATNTIYVANYGGGVTVINGTTNSPSTVTDSGADPYPVAVAVNPVTNQVYVLNRGVDDGINGNVTVIDGATNTTTTVNVPTAGTAAYPSAVAVNPVANLIYVANLESGDVTVIDGSTNSYYTTVADSNASGPFAVGVNPVTNKIYVANEYSYNVTVIDGDTNTFITVGTGTNPLAVAANPATNTIYVANALGNSVTVINAGANTVSATVSVGTDPVAVAVNPVTNTIYVVNNGSSNITAIDGATNSTTIITDPNATNPQALAVNPVTNTIYAANNGSSNVTVINGAAAAVVATVGAGTTPSAVAVNPVTDKIYVANSGGGTVTVIDGPTATVSATVGVGTNPLALAVNLVTNKIYVANNGSANVTVIDGATDTAIATVAAGTNPVAVDVNPITNFAYVANAGGGITVIDGTTYTVTTTITDTSGITPNAVAVDPVTNHVYVANEGNADNSGNITVIDGTTNTFTNVMNGNAIMPVAVAVNPLTGTAYVANASSNNLTAIAPELVQAIPILTTITPLINNQTNLLVTNFNFTATNNLTTAPIDNLLFQVDTWQGPWLAALNQVGSNFTGSSPTLQPGFHILYAYSTDGEEATSTETGRQSSPLIGNISVYGFLVAAPEAGFSPSTVPFGQQAVGTLSTAQTVTLTNSGSAPLNIASIAFSGTNPNDFQETDNCASPLAGPGTCTINITFTPSLLTSESATLTVTDDSGDLSGSQQVVDLTGTGIQATTTTGVTSSANPSILREAVTFTAAVTPQGSYTPTGTVTFNDGAAAICAGVALSSGGASCAISTLAVGQHSVTAVYSGDTNFHGSTSPILTQTVGLAPLTITASSGSFTYGAPVPTITPSYSGFVNGDTAASLTTPPVCSTTATSSSPVSGSPYPSSCSGAVDSNYTILYVNGSVTESSATTSTAITGITPNPSMAGQPVTVSYAVTVNAPGSGTIPGTDTVTVTDGTGASCKGTIASGNCALVPTAVGPDTMIATYSGDSNFSTSKTSVSISFSIVPSVSLTGLTPTNPPTQSTSVGVALNTPTPTQLTGTLTLSFQSNAAGTPQGFIDPGTQFAAGGTTISFTIPAGSAVATLPQNGAIQQGTTAGTIIVTLTALVSGTTTVVLPQPNPSLSVTVPSLAPVITSGSGTITGRSATGFNVELDAYSTPRDLANATFTFQPASGAHLNGTEPFSVSLDSVAPAWFSSSSGLQSGGLFHLTVPFTFSGDTSALGSVTVTLSNSVGSSSPVTVTF